jgi:hypothetical protein
MNGQLCECGCGKPANDVITFWADDSRLACDGLKGAFFNEDCARNERAIFIGEGVRALAERIRARRAELAKKPRCRSRFAALSCHLEEGHTGCHEEAHDGSTNHVQWVDYEPKPKTRPDPLPQTLPIGTLVQHGGDAYIATSTLRLDPGVHAYRGDFRATEGVTHYRETFVPVDWIDWVSVPALVPVDREQLHIGVDLAFEADRCSFCRDPFSQHDPCDGSMHRSCAALVARRDSERSVEAATAACCSECAAPIPRSQVRCDYCGKRLGGYPEAIIARRMDGLPEQLAARSRNAAALEAERPRPTARSRELAKGHPASWPSQVGEE